MGVTTAPVRGSGSCPAWIAIVSKPKVMGPNLDPGYGRRRARVPVLRHRVRRPDGRGRLRDRGRVRLPRPPPGLQGTRTRAATDARGDARRSADGGDGTLLP